MTSPYATGGGGVHLEARVAASCLAAILCESSIRGLPGERATMVRSQRAAFGDPLDDLIVDGARHDGQATALHLQVKNKLTFTKSDDEWVDTLVRAWETFSKPGFDPINQRLGVGIGTYTARADQHYQSVVNWAEHSTDAAHFFERVRQGNYAHQDKQSFVIIHFDFQSAATSRDVLDVVERLKGLFAPENRDQADRLWDHLVSKAGELIPAGGGATRATLIEQLARDGWNVGAAPSFWRDIEALNRDSVRALGDIKSHIHGLKLHRAKAYQMVFNALSEGRFVQIDGGPGSGKSGLLKEIAEECMRTGPVLVLKDSRIHPNGWAAHAHILGVSNDIAALLQEFASAGEPILFIDGIDKIVDPAAQLTVNDLLKAIANDPALGGWRVLVTIREQNLKHLETWLDPDALKGLPLRTVEVGPLDDDELSLVADSFPRLRPILTQSGGPDVILRRPFFLNALLGVAGSTGDLPATEVELLKLWWEMGGSDRREFSPSQHRRNLLVQAANAVVRAPNAPIPVGPLAPEVLEELKSAGVLRDKEFGHSVVFAHDIYEEWALCELLIGWQSNLAELLRETAEPDVLIRPVQLLGAYALETNPAPDAWKALFNATGDAALRPVWQRGILTSCLQSTRTTELLDKLTDHLFENGGERLQRLMLAMSTTEILPNPLFLNEQLTPNIEPNDRAKFAHLTALPKVYTWVRFLDWLMPQLPTLPQTLVPDLLPVFKTWQDAYAGRRIRHCRQIGEISYGWLKEIEDASHPADWSEYRQPFGGAISSRDVEKPVRALFLSSTGDVPKLATEYLAKKASETKHAHMFRDGILKNCQKLCIYLPKQFVDYMLATFLENPDIGDDPFGSYSSHVFDELGIADHHEFYPASPLQAPFLQLLRQHEDEALRLIRALCNHSVSIWRTGKLRGRPYTAPLTPLPVTLTFPWGTQEFWGDNQVYLWFRGIWGNDAVKSALMALERWALEKLEAGAAFEDIFRKVIEGNESVAALGLGASLCLSRPGEVLPCALPLVTSTHVWEWDIARVVQERTPTNQMGNWHHDRLQLEAVRDLNQKYDRKRDIRTLVGYFVIADDDALREAFTVSVRSFPDRLPLLYEEQKGDTAGLAALRQQMELFSEQADPQYWRAARTEDGNIQLWNEPPSLQKEQYQRQQEQHVQLNAFLGVALWANNSIENGSLEGGISLDDALAKAREWDSPELFDESADSFNEKQRAAAVVGAAYAIAMHTPDSAFTLELGTWCMDVFERAAAMLESPEEHLGRGSSLLMHPTVFAVRGYSALLARGFEVETCQGALLSLAVDILEGVQIAVLAGARDYAEVQAPFYWVLLDLMLRQSIVERGAIPDFHASAWDRQEADRKLELLERAASLLTSRETPSLPTIPMPWVQIGLGSQRRRRDTKGYARNETAFLWDLGGKIIEHVRLEPILVDARRRSEFLILVRGMLDYTLQEIVPPFADKKQRHHESTPYEWVYAFSRWCGQLCLHLTPAEAEDLILSPVWAHGDRAALQVMQSLMRTFMIRAFLKEEPISDEHLALWREMADWLFERPEWMRGRHNDHLDRDFTSCAFTTLFCVAPDLSPLVCGIDPGWPHLGKFLPIIERAICEFGENVTLYLAVTTFLKHGGMDLLPEPALGWLQRVVAARKGNRDFWDANGETTVELLKQVISEKGGLLTPDHRKVIMSIADILIDEGVRGAGFLQQELLRLG